MKATKPDDNRACPGSAEHDTSKLVQITRRSEEKTGTSGTMEENGNGALVPIASMEVPSLLPVCLPLDAQMSVLRILRHLLWRVHKQYAQQASLELTPEGIWGSSSLGDLLRWQDKFKSQEGVLVPSAEPDFSNTSADWSLSVTGIALAVEHKLLLPINTIKLFLRDSVTLTYLLQDNQRASKLQRFAGSIFRLADELAKSKGQLYTRLQASLADKIWDSELRRTEAQNEAIINFKKAWALRCKLLCSDVELLISLSEISERGACDDDGQAVRSPVSTDGKSPKQEEDLINIHESGQPRLTNAGGVV